MPNEIWKKIVESEVIPPSKHVASIPLEMDKVVNSALAKNPNQRFSSGLEMAENLLPFFAEVGQEKVKAMLGNRVVHMMHKGDDVSNATTRYEMDAFLPPAEDVKDQTQEIHLDEILQLVEPIEVPKPLIQIEENIATVQTKEKIELVQPNRIKNWILLAVCSGLLTAGLLWWFWPESSGVLSVESDVRAEVYVDGQRMGLAPLKELSLPTGTHVIELRRPGRNQVKRYQKTIEEGKLTELVVKWKVITTDKKNPNKSDKRSYPKEKKKKRKKT
jgi:hypothetical protein